MWESDDLKVMMFCCCSLTYMIGSIEGPRNPDAYPIILGTLLIFMVACKLIKRRFPEA